MKVLHVTNLYPTSNHPTYGIFVKEQIDSLNDDQIQNLYFINAKEYGIISYIKAIKDLFFELKKYDIIHCHHQFSILPIIFLHKKKIILSVLGDLGKRSFLNRFIFKMIKFKCNRIIFKNKIPNNDLRYSLLPNGVNTDFFYELPMKEARKKINLDLDKIYVLFVCNGDLENKIKRKDKFDQVLNELNKNGEIYHELILSNVTRENVLYYYNSANLMLVTSDHEGSPNAVKEAMACNLPIVSTPVGDVPRNLENVFNSFVCNTFEIDELVNNVLKVNLNEKSNSRFKIFSLKLDVLNIANELKKIYLTIHEKN